MAYDKEIYFNDTFVGYGNKADVKPETSNSEVKTFTGVITDGSSEIPWEVSIDKIRYGKIKDYVKIEKILHKMFTVPGTITIIERTKTVDGILTVKQIIYNCIVSDKSYSLDPEARTVESLTFKGSKMKEWVNGEEIPF